MSFLFQVKWLFFTFTIYLVTFIRSFSVFQNCSNNSIAIADWTDTHAVFGMHPNSGSTTLIFKDFETQFQTIISIGFPVIQIKTHPSNTNISGNLIIIKSLDPIKSLYVYKIDDSSTVELTGDTWGYSFGQTNDIVYYIVQSEDKIKRYSISMTNSVDIQRTDGAYNSYKVACDNNMVFVLALNSVTDILWVEKQVGGMLETINTITQFTTQNKSSNLQYYSNYRVYEQFSVSMGRMLITQGNKLFVLYPDGSIDSQVLIQGKVVCSCYFNGVVAYVEESNQTTKFIKIIDIITTEVLFQQEIIFQTLDLCQIKYFSSVDKVTLHPFDSHQIYDITLNSTNGTNGTNATNGTNRTNEVNATNGTNVTNEVNATNGTNVTNGGNDTTNIQSIIQLQPSQDQTIRNIKQVIESEPVQISLNTSTIFLSIIMASPFSNLGFKPLFFFIDDLWLYSYHAVLYNWVIEFFVADINILSVLRVNPLDSLNIKQILFRQYLDNEALYQNQLGDIVKSPNEHVFLLATQQVYIENLGLCIVIFTAYMVSKLLFRYAVLRSWTEKVYKNQFTYSYLIISFVLPNTSKILFFASRNITTPFQFNFYDKLNFVILFLFLFVWLSFNAYIYPVMYMINKKDDIHQYTKKRQRGLIFEILFVNIRCCCRSIIHGLLFQNNQIQLWALITMDILVICGSFRFRKSFKTSLTFLLYFGYQLAFLVFDAGLYSDIYFPIEQLNYELLFLVTIFSILGFSLFQSANLILLNIIDFSRRKCGLIGNQVKPKPPTAKKKPLPGSNKPLTDNKDDQKQLNKNRKIRDFTNKNQQIVKEKNEKRRNRKQSPQLQGEYIFAIVPIDS